MISLSIYLNCFIFLKMINIYSFIVLDADLTFPIVINGISLLSIGIESDDSISSIPSFVIDISLILISSIFDFWIISFNNRIDLSVIPSL